jgi:hypothetical protein
MEGGSGNESLGPGQRPYPALNNIMRLYEKRAIDKGQKEEI